MGKRVVSYFVFFQLVIIIILLYKINHKEILGVKSSGNLLNKEQYIFPKIDGLNFFYEPKPNSTNLIDVGRINTNGPVKPVYKINSDGLNQTENFDAKKKENTFRIITIGDSFTFGLNVNTEDNYPSRLQNILDMTCKKNKFEVLNLGVGGYDFRYTVERFKLRGQKYNPDIVLWFIISDDFHRIDELLIPQLNSIRQDLKTSGEYEQYMKNQKYNIVWNKANEYVMNKLGETKILDQQKLYLLDLEKYFDKKLIVITTPKLQKKYKELLKEVVATYNKGTFYDGIPDIYSQNDAYLPDYHPSPKGYKLIAENIFNYLKDNMIIPCQN